MLLKILCCISYKRDFSFVLRVDTMLAIVVKGGHFNKNDLNFSNVKSLCSVCFKLHRLVFFKIRLLLQLLSKLIQ